MEKTLRAVSSKHDVVAAQITDPRELALPDVGRVVLQDPETGEQILVNTSHADVRLKFAARVQENKRRLCNFCGAAGLQRIAIRTDEDYVPALKAYFRSRKRRKRG